MKGSAQSGASTLLEDILAKAYIGMLVFLPVSLIFSRKLSSIVFVSLVVVWLLSGGYRKISQALKDRFVILFISIAGLLLVSLMLSDNKDFSLLEKSASLLLLPIIFFSTHIRQKNVLLVLHGFIAGCLVAAVYTLIVTARTGAAFDTEMTFNALGITHVYFGYYLSFAIAFLGHRILNGHLSRVTIIIAVIIALFLTGFMLLLGGKMSIISLFILTFIAGILFLVKTRRWSLGLAVIIVPTVILVLSFSYVDGIRSRFSYLFMKEHYYVGDNGWTSLGVRLTIFECSQKVLKDIWTGTGIGDVQNDLNDCYDHSGFKTVIGMNAHNQYLQWILGAGLIGLSIFLITLIVPSVITFQTGNYLYLCFIFLFAFCCLTESLLERQQGVMFFAFFNSLLFFRWDKNESQKETP